MRIIVAIVSRAVRACPPPWTPPSFAERTLWMPVRCALVGLALLATLGCQTRDLGPIDPKVSRFFEVQVGNDGVADVDVLFVVDNSGSMKEEQVKMVAEIGRLVEDLTSPPTDAAGEPLWNPVESLHVAVVTTDLGTGGAPYPNAGAACNANSGHGDGGALRSVQRWNLGEDIEAFVADVAATADAGLGGCGLEQQLLAGSLGLRADPEFPRPDALLAVVVLSDEEDCSIANPGTFFSTTAAGKELNRRCVRAPEALVPIDTLVSDLRGDRPDSRFVFAAIAGIPEDLSSASPEALLADGRMQYIDADNSLGLEPACRSGDGLAAPGRRYVEIASRIEGALVSSICAASFRPAIAALTERIGERVNAVCARRALTPDAAGQVECAVREVLPTDTRCDTLPARTFVGMAEDGTRERCEVAQVGADRAQGWRYDVSDPSCDRVLYTDDAVPPFGALVELECLVDVEVSTEPSAALAP